MAIQAGRVEVPVGITLEGQAVKVVALTLAIQVIGEHKGFRAPEDAALSAARAFEQYLNTPKEGTKHGR